jgi:RHS repeat-associated protein
VSSATCVGANELTQWGTANLTYDLDGNLLSDGVSSYTWNARNQLASVNVSGTNFNFGYDAFGRRIENPIGNQLLYDGPNAVQEISGGTAVANRLTGGLDEFFSRTDSTGTFSPLTDALGSTVALTDTNGNLQTQYTYEPFGNTTTIGPANANPYQFTGRENDGTGLYYYRARYYSPIYQRFISEDPMQLRAGPNFYAYVHNNPVNLTDPSGLCPEQNPCPPSGDAPSPEWYQAEAQNALSLEGAINDFFQEGADLLNFSGPGSLNAQNYGASAAYANYVYGVYLGAVGLSLSTALSAANLYGEFFSTYNPTPENPMDSTYTHIPASNVANITNGYNDQQDGTLCSQQQRSDGNRPTAEDASSVVGLATLRPARRSRS